VIVVFACTQMIGYALAWRDLYFFGKATVMAPMPTPFNAVGPYESLRTTRTYIIQDTEGQSFEASLDAALTEAISGPHTRKIPYLQVLRYAPKFPRPLVDSVLKYTFCRGPGREVLAQFPNVKDVTVAFHNETYPPYVWRHTIVCV
jgi:hypothetical protein